MFPDYEPPEELKEALSQAAVVAADIDPERGAVSVALHCGTYIPKRSLDVVTKNLQDSYGLRELQISMTYPAHQISKIEPEELMALFVRENSMNRGSLAGAQWNWEGEKLTVKLLGNGLKALEESAPNVCRTLREQFAVPVTIYFEAGQTLEGEALFAALAQMRGKMIPNRTSAATAEAPKKAQQQESVAFYGKPIKAPSVPMQDVTLDMSSVVVEGRVFAVEHKELKKRNAWVINFDMTDNYGSVRINRFMEDSEAKPIL